MLLRVLWWHSVFPCCHIFLFLYTTTLESVASTRVPKKHNNLCNKFQTQKQTKHQPHHSWSHPITPDYLPTIYQFTIPAPPAACPQVGKRPMARKRQSPACVWSIRIRGFFGRRMVFDGFTNNYGPFINMSSQLESQPLSNLATKTLEAPVVEP